MRVFAFLAAVTIATPAYTADWKALTVGQAISIYSALTVITQPFPVICKDGPSEKQCQKRYSLKPGIIRTLAAIMTATKTVQDRFNEDNNKTIDLLSGGAGKVPDDKMAAFFRGQSEERAKTVYELMGIELHFACIKWEDMRLEDNPEFPIGAGADLAPLLVEEGCK